MDTLGDHIRFHHVGVITGHLDASIALYEQLGYAASEIYVDPIQQARIVLMQRPQEPLIELITPDGPGSPAAKWMERLQAGPYHTCYEVDDLEGTVAALRQQHLVPVLGPAPAVAFNMRRVIFVWSNRSGLLEWLEAGE